MYGAEVFPEPADQVNPAPNSLFVPGVPFVHGTKLPFVLGG